MLDKKYNVPIFIMDKKEPFEVDCEYENKKKSLVYFFYINTENFLNEKYSLKFTNKKNQLGVCNPFTRTIGLSNIAIKYLSVEENKDTILHEIAHALQYQEMGYTKHDSHFYGYCRKVGANPKRCFEGQFIGKYKKACKCGKTVIYYDRLSDKRRASINFSRCEECNNTFRIYLTGNYHTNENDVDIDITDKVRISYSHYLLLQRQKMIKKYY